MSGVTGNAAGITVHVHSRVDRAMLSHSKSLGRAAHLGLWHGHRCSACQAALMGA